MSFYNVAVIVGYSIAIPAIIGLIRYSKIDKAYQPFIFYCAADVLNHSLSAVLIRLYHSNTVNSNIFVFIEACLFLMLFRNWGLFKNKQWQFYFLVALLTVSWIIDNLIWHKLDTVNSFFRITYSFVLVFLSIGQFNILIASAKKNLLLNSCFLICCGIMIYYSYKATIEVFFLIQLKASAGFYLNIFRIMVFTNLFANFIFSWATLWIPRRPKYILQH